MTSPSRHFPNGSLRVSDADRDRALTELSGHYQAGRLDAEEFDERSGQALKAKTGQELHTLFADLPDDQAQAPWIAPSQVADWTGPPVPDQAGRRRIARPASGALAPAIRVAAAVVLFAVIFAALTVGHRSDHNWGGIVLPLVLVLLIVRRITRGRR
jgi:hypothetical protein